MTLKTSRAAAALSAVAAASLMATPAMARGWGGGWGGGWGHRDRVDAGDILAGVLVIGTIAAVASAASKASKAKQDASYPEPRYDDRYEQRGDSQRDRADYGRADDRPEWGERGGINAAMNRCVDEVSRGDGEVDQVDSVNRTGDDWKITGRMSGGGDFSCIIDRDGRIRNVNIDGRAI